MIGNTLTVILIAVAVFALLWALGQRKVTTIYPPNVGLLYRNGKFERELAPGRYVFFDPGQRTRIIEVSMAERPVNFTEFTVISKDQFSFRIAMAPMLKVADARAYAEAQGLVSATSNPFLVDLTFQPIAASAATEAVAALTLRELLAAPQPIADAVRASLATAVPGAAIERVLLTAITLPPETRKMFTEVERSRMEAEASLERARGEHASLRVLANAARLIKDNPALSNLRFLQSLEQIPGPKTIVVGNSGLSLGEAGATAS